MAISLLLRSLTRRGLMISSSPSSYRCLSGNVKSLKTPCTSSPFCKGLTSLVTRPFSSIPSAAIDVVTEGTKTVIESQKRTSEVNYRIVEAPHGDAWVETADGMQFSLSQIGPYVFTKIKNFVKSSTGRTISKSVIIVPAYFNEAQRKATKDVASIAGLDVHRIITNKQTADAFPYGIKHEEYPIAVFYLSDGTFDLCVQEQATSSGNSLLEYMVGELKRTHGFDATKEPLALEKLEEAVKKAMAQRTSWTSHPTRIEINLPAIAGEAERSFTITWTNK